MRVDGGADETAVGFDGVVYFESLDATQLLRARVPGRPDCRVRLDLGDAIADAIAQVGPLTCREEPVR